MASRLLNIRLGPEDDRVARELRARGVSISALVRRALRAEAERMRGEPEDAEQLLDDIFARYPTPPEGPSERPDATDRQAVRRHVQRQLRRKR